MISTRTSARSSSHRTMLAPARLAALLVALTVAVSACVNQGTDGDGTGLGGVAVDDDARADGGTGTEGGGTGSGGDVDADLPVGAVPDPASLASIEPVECSFDEVVPLSVRPTCHAVSVPERWDDPDPDDRVVLQVAVFDGDGSENDALIYLDGGPGGNTLDSLSFSFPALVEPFLDGRDYIVFDQRGVGLSDPVLDCPELEELARADLAGEVAAEDLGRATLAAEESCRDRLETAGVDLSAYNSVASANDVEAIRSLLGYRQLNPIGISYGTRLGQTYLRMYPDSVRSIVLDSIFPTEADLWTNLAPGAVRAFERLFRGCEEDPACAATHPDLEERFFAMLDRFDAEPVEVELSDLIDGSTVDAVLDGDDVIGLVFSALYDRTQFSLVPAMVAEVEEGDYGTVGFFGSVEITNLPYISSGMQLSVECNEEIPFESEAALEANTPQDPNYARLQRLDGGVTLFEVCRAWPAGRAPDVEDETVVSEVPALLLAGDYDPITPPAGADAVAAGLANHFSYLLPNDGHGITGTACGAELITAFIDDPTVAPDDSCVATSPAPVWVPPDDDGPVELVDFATEGLVAVSGRRPAAWVDAGNGIFARQRTARDQTTLIIQPSAGLAADTLVGFLGDQTGIEFSEADPLVIDGQEWPAYRGVDADTEARLAVSPGPGGVLVLLLAEPGEMDRLYETVFLPVAESASSP